MSVIRYENSPVASLHVSKQRIDKNLAAMIDPTVDGICPNGMTQPVMVKVFPVNQNLVLANGTDLVVVWAPESATQTQGQLFAVSQAGVYSYVGDITPSVDMSTYSEAMTVSSVLTVFSDTISTTNTVLSGRVSAVGMFNVLAIRPTWDSIGKYVSDPKASMINTSLADGIVCLQCPNPKKIMHQVNTILGHSKDFYMSQAPIATINIPKNNDETLWTIGSAAGSFDLGLHALSGKYPLFISLNPTGMNRGNTMYAPWTNGWDPEQSTLTITFQCLNTAGNAYVNQPVQLPMHQNEWTVIPPRNTISFTLTANITPNPAIGEGLRNYASEPLRLAAFSGNPLTADSSAMKYLVYVQGNIGEKNINISGWTRYEMIPTPENMQLATYRRILAYNPMTFEAFQVLLDQLEFFKLCTDRMGYASMLQLIPYLTLGEVGELADNAASASLALAPLIRGVVSKIKQLGISPANLLRKGTTGLHKLADHGIDRLEELGFARVGYASSLIGQPYQVKEVEDDEFAISDPKNPISVTCAYSAATPVGFPVNPYSLSASSLPHNCGYASLSVPTYKGSTIDLEDLVDAEDSTPEVKPAQEPTAVEGLLVEQNNVLSEEIIQATIDCTFRSDKWKKFVNGDANSQELELYRASFFYMVGVAPRMSKRTGTYVDVKVTIPAALVLSTNKGLTGHNYIPFGNWMIDSCIDDKETDETKLTSMEKAKYILICPEVVGPLRALVLGHSKRSTIQGAKVYLSIVMGHSDIKIMKDTSWTGALYGAIHANNPLCIFEAACTPYGLVNARNKLIATMCNWVTPSELKLKLIAAMFRMKDGFLSNLQGFYKEYVPAIVLSSISQWNDVIITELSNIGISYVNNVPTGMNGVVDLVSDMSLSKKPPFYHKQYAVLAGDTFVDVTAMRELPTSMKQGWQRLYNTFSPYPSMAQKFDDLIKATNRLSKDDLESLAELLKNPTRKFTDDDKKTMSKYLWSAAQQWFSIMKMKLKTLKNKANKVPQMTTQELAQGIHNITSVSLPEGKLRTGEPTKQEKTVPVTGGSFFYGTMEADDSELADD